MKSSAAPKAPTTATSQAVPRMGIIKLVNLLRAEIIDALDRELAPFDITAPQLLVLSTAMMEDPPSPASICKTMSYDPGAMTRMIDRLEQKGLCGGYRTQPIGGPRSSPGRPPAR